MTANTESTTIDPLAEARLVLDGVSDPQMRLEAIERYRAWLSKGGPGKVLDIALAQQEEIKQLKHELGR